MEAKYKNRTIIADITEEQMKELLELIKKAEKDPDYAIIKNYQIEWIED